MGARRRRLRESLGDRGQALASFCVLGGLGSRLARAFLRAWMPAAAPWGFAVPFVFVIGYLLIDWRRQAALARGGDAAKACARPTIGSRLLLVVRVRARGRCRVRDRLERRTAAPPQDEEWTPPESSVSVDISP